MIKLRELSCPDVERHGSLSSEQRLTE